MSTCGAEFAHPTFAVVCRLAVHSSGDHMALLDGTCDEYGGAKGRAEAQVTWPMVSEASQTHRTAPWSDRGVQSGPKGHRYRQGRGEALDESEGKHE